LALGAAFCFALALIFAGIGCVFPVAVSILSVRSNERLGPAVAGAAGNVTPLFAVLFAARALGERIALGRRRPAGGGNLMVAEKRRNGRLNSSDASETFGGWLA
jgi:hypothetical protein